MEKRVSERVAERLNLKGSRLLSYHLFIPSIRSLLLVHARTLSTHTRTLKVPRYTIVKLLYSIVEIAQFICFVTAIEYKFLVPMNR